MPKNELKAKILSEIATGATAQQCAVKYNIPSGTIRSWLSRAKRNTDTKKPATKNATRRKSAARQNTKEPVIKLEDVDEELTEKQRLFCWYFVHNHNATQAAIRAGYSFDSARQIGYELLTKPYIRAEVERLKKLKAYSLMLKPEDIVLRNMQIALADMTDVADWGTEEIPDLYPFTGAYQIDEHGNINKLF
jgi:phage terminase small subunit